VPTPPPVEAPGQLAPPSDERRSPPVGEPDGAPLCKAASALRLR
jgi:hypothetical protein